MTASMTARNQTRRNQLRMGLIIIILVTLPCYCAGLVRVWSANRPIPTPTATVMPAVRTATPSNPLVATSFPTFTATMTPLPVTGTATLTMTATETPTLTPTETTTATETSTPTLTLSPTATELPTDTPVPTETPIPTETETPGPERTLVIVTVTSSP